MLDVRLRSLNERVFGPIARASAGRVAPLTLSVLGALLCIGAGVAAWRGQAWVAVACWWAGRLLDGLDGAVARAGDRQSDRGGYADFMLDVAGYAAVPIGVAAGAADLGHWAIVAVLLASFYLNAASLLLLSAIIEKRAGGGERGDGPTTVTLPPALVEGAETIVLFTIALAVPEWAAATLIVMTVGVAISVVQRVVAAQRLLR